MPERASVEKTIDVAMLETGEVRLTQREQHLLELSDRSGALPLVADGETMSVLWTAGRRTLTSERLLDFLQDTARTDDLLRLERRQGAGLEASVITRQSAFRESVAAGWDRDGWWNTGPAAAAPAAARPATSVPRAPRRANRGERYRLRQRDEYQWYDGVGFLRYAQDNLRSALQRRGWDPPEDVALRLTGERLATLDQFDELLALDASHIEHMQHQEAAARTVLTRMSGRAILADEVGLGKTVEAGLILKELMLRRLVERILIVCPAPLREQWREELRDKFDEEFVVVARSDAPEMDDDHIIMTPQLLLRNASRFPRPFDLIVFDEAHRLSGATARRTRQVVGDLVSQAPRVLFLTATPVQNNLLELYRLIELLRPGTFRSEGDFLRRFVDQRDQRRPRNAGELRTLISSVVVRTTRTQAGVDRVRRMPPQDRAVLLSPPERRLYDLIVDTLRHRMTGPADTMRRRQLALRLTASPEAVSRSALRMAGKHDGELRKLLSDIGHLAGDIRHTSREQVALGVIQRWLDEHGRVLVFTAHTDTLLGIQKLLDREGIGSVAFHGSMSHTARAESVADFKAGKARVLVSTDAGAEGQNLQVCNCVLNYDLPWNPMRVEQRIGRVHRLTQTRDVYIANLFARDTIDEAVYRLLHDKLAMFELLFGQVVTVLGELEGSQDTTIENRVLEALYQNSDRTMQARLDELGRQLEQARGKADRMMATDSGLSQWLAQRQEERAVRSAVPEATELRPQPVDRPRRRQHEVERFVSDFLARAGARLERPSEGLLIATLPDDLVEKLDGRRELYLAFTNAALDAHGDAELCVVGSEVFDELLDALRERGDLTGTVPRVPAVPQLPTLTHQPALCLVHRELVPTDGWSARATYRVQDGANAGNQRLVTVELGRPPLPNLSDTDAGGSKGKPSDVDGAEPERDVLPDGAQLPIGLTEDAVLGAVDRQAAIRLRAELDQLRAAERDSQRASQRQLLENLRQQYVETEAEMAARRYASGSEELAARLGQLSRAIEAAEKSGVDVGDRELRAELLTLELHGADRLDVLEQWRHDSGATRTIRYPWTGALTDPKLVCEASGTVITTLALCVGNHAVDESAVRRCELCGRDGCAVCAPQHTVKACRACEAPVCGSCRDNGPLCEPCRQPVRVPDQDTRWEHAWQMGAGTQLLVGARHATLVRPAGEHLTVLPAADMADPARTRVRALAHRLGAPAGAGFTVVPDPPDEVLTAGALWARVERSRWWNVAPVGSGHLDPPVDGSLPDLSAPPALGQEETGLGDLLARLRPTQSTPDTPDLVSLPFTVVRRVDVRDGQFVFRELWYDGTGDGEVAAERVAVPRPSLHPTAPYGRPVARAAAGTVTVEVDGVHRSYLCRLSDGQRSTAVFLPGVPGADAVAEEHLARLVAGTGLGADHVVVRDPRPPVRPQELRYSQTGPDTTVERSVEESWCLVDAGDGEPLTVPPLPAPAHLDTAAAQTVDDEALRERLRYLDARTDPVALAPYLTVDETWRSPAGQATRRYLVAPAAPVDVALLTGRTLVRSGAPVLAQTDDGSPGESALSVDSQGHLHAASGTAPCPVCRLVYCAGCGPQAVPAPCRTCGRLACGTCRHGVQTDSPETICQRCGDRSCRDCSRLLPLATCGLCGREVCGACQTGQLCLTCRALAPATDAEVATLPATLAARGLTVLLAHDQSASVVGLIGAERVEVAVVSAGTVVRWEGTGRDDPARLARIAAAQHTGVGNIAVTLVDGRAEPPGDGPLVLGQRTDTRVAWQVVDAQHRLAGNASTIEGATLPAARDSALFADVEKLIEATAPETGSGQGPDAGPAPALAPPDRAALLQHLAGRYRPSAPPARLIVSRLKRHETVLLRGNGLVHRIDVGSHVEERVAAWERPQQTPEWAVAGWRPSPEIVAMSTVDSYTAVIAAVGGYAVLGITADGSQPRWLRLGGDPADMHRAAFGRFLLRRQALVSVADMATPAALRGPRIVAARPLSRRVVPELDTASHDGTGDVAPATVLTALTTETVAAPAARVDVPPEVAAALREWVDNRPVERLRRSVALRVAEDWQLPAGGILTVEYRVPAGSTDGYLTDAVTGKPLVTAYACRDWHLVAEIAVCAHCLTGTCAQCPQPATACSLCGGWVCGRCAAGDGRCPACAAIQKPGVLARRKLQVPRGAQVWHGATDRCQVTVWDEGGVWSLRRKDHTGTTDSELPGWWVEEIRRFLPGLA